MNARNLIPFSALLVLAASLNSLQGQSGNTNELLLQKLNQQFILTRMTADGTDVVKAGSPITLHKDGLQMCSVDAKIPIMNAYKEGKLSAGKFAWSMAMGLVQPSLPTNSVPMRTFVTDEKFWVTAIGIQKNAVIFKVYSDTYGDTRYYAELEFPFNKKSVPPVDELLKSISEVVTADSAGATTADDSPAPAAQPAPPPPPTMAPPPAPPPPTDAAAPPPPTVSLGQTMDQVTATMGQPKSVAKVGAKTIFNYMDLKVIFVGGKVSDVQ